MNNQASLLLEEQPASQAQQLSQTSLPLQPLPHFVKDNLPQIAFDATVNCLLEDNPSRRLSFEQFVDMISNSKPDLDSLPEKVLIDARGLTPAAFHPLMIAYLAYKLQHPTHEAVLITGN